MVGASYEKDFVGSRGEDFAHPSDASDKPAIRSAGDFVETTARSDRVVFEWSAARPSSDPSCVLGVEYDGARLIVVGLQPTRSGRPVVESVLATRYSSRPSADTLAERLQSVVGSRQPRVHLVLATPRAVVRHYTVPPVPAKQRESAALWEGQKLIPFPLATESCLYGLAFQSAGERGWSTTLVAIPREDGAEMLMALDQLGWNLRGISLAGTLRPPVEPGLVGKDAAFAVVSWSRERGSFAVFDDRQLVFHYDLGPMPAAPGGMGVVVSPESTATWQRWLESLGVVVADALDFHLNVNPSLLPSRLTVFGLPLSAAPLLTDWQARFSGGVELFDLTNHIDPDLPDGVKEWLEGASGLASAALTAAIGSPTVDLTPKSVQQKRDLYRYERIARTALVISLAVCACWSALLWRQIRSHEESQAQLKAQLEALNRSPVASMFQATVAQLARARLVLGAVEKTGTPWMPWFRTVLSTMPEPASLTHADMQSSPDGGEIVHLEGTLSPSASAHPVVYREWFERLAPLCVPGGVTLASERGIEWKGKMRSAFTIQLRTGQTRASQSSHPEVAQ